MENQNRKPFNGSSLSSLTGAVPSAKLQVEVRFPAASVGEVIDAIRQLNRTGSLTVNFRDGRMMDAKFSSSRDTRVPEV